MIYLLAFMKWLMLLEKVISGRVKWLESVQASKQRKLLWVEINRLVKEIECSAQNIVTGAVDGTQKAKKALEKDKQTLAELQAVWDDIQRDVEVDENLRQFVGI